MSVVYDIEAVTKHYPGAAAPANDEITFTVARGEIFGLLGPNGAGKTTLVRQLSGLLRPTSGRITLFGTDVTAHPHVVAEHVALQPQSPAALLDLTAAEAVHHTGRLRGLTTVAARAQTAALLALLGIDQLAARRVRTLSGGEKRLVSLAVTLVADRPVLILDEPTNDLDPAARRLVWDHLRKLNAEGRTIILVTHDVAEAERVIDRVGLVNHGRLLALGPTAELRRRVDQRVRLDIALPEHTDPVLDELLADAGDQLVRDGDRALLLVARDRVRDVLDAVADRIGPTGLSDLRVQGPSLEDVYLQLGGRDRLG
ncbi:ABC transporter ATP-binding protein [Catellatospora tritici]|uniref:ABC transporter ATP-binding protein n=1 Tax=Catellatospora tritici TaxID=2851566 RepID=UPI001C2D6403|nr:ABC transporter ATP-binding protein [Catellatospora tritici]MBV1850754.1 ABC transporter ATP-binding protein [Catellatospora tritici]MBV1851007.1 ABC transporter ATP-binding protein [Catellatospora tritici]